MNNPIRNYKPIQVRVGKITAKRQLTIPKDFYEQFNFGENVELVLEHDGIKIKKIKSSNESFEDFSDLILEDLIAEGFSGKELLDEFKIRKNLIPVAFSKMVDDMERSIKKDNRSSSDLDQELFGEK